MKKSYLEYLKNKINTESEPSFSVYMVRDADVVRDAGLADLAWALCGVWANCSQNDAIGFFEDLEKYLLENNLLEEE